MKRLSTPVRRYSPQFSRPNANTCARPTGGRERGEGTRNNERDGDRYGYRTVIRFHEKAVFQRRASYNGYARTLTVGIDDVHESVALARPTRTLRVLVRRNRIGPRLTRRLSNFPMVKFAYVAQYCRHKVAPHDRLFRPVRNRFGGDTPSRRQRERRL